MMTAILNLVLAFGGMVAAFAVAVGWEPPSDTVAVVAFLGASSACVTSALMLMRRTAR